MMLSNDSSAPVKKIFVEPSDALDVDDNTEDLGEEFESTWVAPTILKVHGIVDPATINSMNKYLNKHPRVWKDSATVDDDFDDEEDEEDDDDEDDEDDAASGDEPTDIEVRRSCFVSAETASLAKYFNLMDPVVQASVEQFVSRYGHFNLISTFDDYACIEYRPGSFRKAAPEKTGIERGEGASRALVALVLLADSDGKDVCFHPAHGGDDGRLWLEGNAGDVFVWPACALHPYEVVARNDRATHFRYAQVNIS